MREIGRGEESCVLINTNELAVTHLERDTRTRAHAHTLRPYVDSIFQPQTFPSTGWVFDTLQSQYRRHTKQVPCNDCRCTTDVGPRFACRYYGCRSFANKKNGPSLYNMPMRQCWLLLWNAQYLWRKFRAVTFGGTFTEKSVCRFHKSSTFNQVYNQNSRLHFPGNVANTKIILV